MTYTYSLYRHFERSWCTIRNNLMVQWAMPFGCVHLDYIWLWMLMRFYIPPPPRPTTTTKKSRDQNLVRFLFHGMLLICLANGHRFHHHSYIQIKEMNKISRIMFAIDTKMPLKVDKCEMRFIVQMEWIEFVKLALTLNISTESEWEWAKEYDRYWWCWWWFN